MPIKPIAKASAAVGKMTSKATSTAKTAKSSGVMSSAKNTRMGKAIMRNPGRSAAIGAAGVAGLGMARSRKSGLNKGRSSMYNY